MFEYIHQPKTSDGQPSLDSKLSQGNFKKKIELHDEHLIRTIRLELLAVIHIPGWNLISVGGMTGKLNSVPVL